MAGKIQDAPEEYFSAVEYVDVTFAVMGVTGAGKSSFVRDCSGYEVKVGESLTSCTREVEDFTFLYKGFRVHMIDTPGFDDTNKSDTEILRDISDWLATSYRAGIKLSGILYLYDISSPRFTGSAKRNLQMFQELCGEDAFPCLVFGTTFWDKIEESRGERREKELQEHFWADMMKRGCHYIRHDDKRISAFKILDLMLSQRRSFTATIQKQLVDDKLDLHQTSAGQALSVDFRKLETEHQATLQKLHEEFQLAMERSDTTAAQKLASEQAKMLLQINEEKEAAKKLRVSRDQLEQEKKEENRKSQERYKAQLIEMNRLRKAQQGQQEFLERSETDREEIKRIVKNLEEDLRSAQRKKDCHKDPEGEDEKLGYAYWIEQALLMLGKIIFKLPL